MRKLAVLSAIAALLGALLVSPASAQAGASIKISKTSVDVGKRVKISGKFPGGDAGDKVLVQLKSGKKWATVAEPKLTKALTYSSRVKVGQTGANKYRALLGKTATPTLTVTGYAWLKLTDQSHFAIADSYVFFGTNVTIGGKKRPSSIFTTQTLDVVWRLPVGRCTTVRLTLGRAEDYDAAVGSFDGSVYYTSTGGVQSSDDYSVTGGPVVVHRPIPNETKLLDIGVGSFTDGSDAGIATPEVRCSVAKLPVVNPDDVDL